jgi:tetratricopeptide (TPR) repeat protein
MNQDHYSLALHSYQTKKYKKALAHLSKVKKQTAATLKLKLQLLYHNKQYLLGGNIGKDLLKYELSVAERKEVSFFTGVCYSEAGDKQSAIECLEISTSLDSQLTNAVTLYNLACLYFQEGFYNKAQVIAKRLLALTSYYSNALVLLMRISAACADKKALVQYSQKLVPEIDKLTNEEVYELARYLISVDDIDSVNRIIEHFESSFKHVSILLKAELLSHEKSYQDLNQYLPDNTLSTLNNADLYYFKAQALDKIGDYSKAFGYCTKAADMKMLEWDKEKINDNLASWNKWLDRQHKNFNKSSISKESKEHQKIAFIFSFPRSGTTLLDNILDTQESVCVLSEVAIIPRLVAKVTQLVKKYPSDIHKLTSSQLDGLRTYYFELAQQISPKITQKHIIVDKGPHHTALLPLLRLIFPNAKFIAAIRHPLDVCLSCFQQNFEFNSDNSFLTTFDRIVQRYIEVFELLSRYESEAMVNITSIKYEDIVDDFEGTVTGLLKFLDIDISVNYRNFHMHAANKYVSSASRGQTNQALYSSSMYKWLNYHELLAAFEEKLTPFIDKYNYKKK